MEIMSNLIKKDIFNFIKNNDINKVNKWLKLYPNNINVINNRGWTPLHRACYNGKLEIVKLLIQKGANVNSNDNYGWTPLHEACWYGHLDIAKLLVDKGADVNSKNNLGNTPLHDASYKSHLEIVKLLIDKGADVNSKNNDGWTPLHWAYYKDNLDISKYLIDKGADIEAKDNEDKTPVDYLNDENKQDILEFININNNDKIINNNDSSYKATYNLNLQIKINIKGNDMKNVILQLENDEFKDELINNILSNQDNSDIDITSKGIKLVNISIKDDEKIN